MIKVQDWIASIPEEEKHIAYVGEGQTEQREFLLCGEGWEKYRDYGFHLDMAFDPVSITTRDCRQVVQTTVNSAEHKEEAGVTKDEVTTKETYTVCDEEVLSYDLTDVAPLDKWVEQEGIRLTWTVLRQHTQLPGKLKATIRAVGEDPNCIKKSAMMVFEVEPSVAATPAAVPPVSEFQQMESEMDALRQGTVEAAQEGMQHAMTAASAAQGAADACDEALNAAQAAQMSADGAASAQQGAVQAQQDAAEHARRAEQYRGDASAQANAAVDACADAKRQAAAAESARISAAGAVQKCSEYVLRAEQSAAEATEAMQEIAEMAENFGYVGIEGTDVEQTCLRFANLLYGTDKAESFLFFTDPHLATAMINFESRLNKYMSTVKTYYDATPTSFVLNGGDTIHEHNTAEQVIYRASMVHSRFRANFDRYYPAVGNHDDNYNGKAYASTQLSPETVRNVMMRGVDELYYSFDGENSKGYVLCSADNTAFNLADQEMTAYHWEQVAWLAEQLKKDDAENSFLLYHHGFTRYGADGAEKGYVVSAFTIHVLKLCEAYNHATTITLNGATYNFAGCTGCVRFVLSGHVHDANAVEYHYGIPVISTYNMRRLETTPTFDLCLADYDAEVLRMKRVGEGSDRDIVMASRTAAGNVYKVSMRLVCASANNSAVSVRAGDPYETQLIVPQGYSFQFAKVTMGGVNITGSAYNEGRISIPSVTGDIAIEAVFAYVPTEVGDAEYTNLADPTSAEWSNTAKWDGNAVDKFATNGSGTVTNFIPVNPWDRLRFYGFDTETKVDGQLPSIAFYDENKNYISSSRRYLNDASKGSQDGVPSTAGVDENGVFNYTVLTYMDGRQLYSDNYLKARYVRIHALPLVPVSALTVTVNEPIFTPESRGSNLADPTSVDWLTDVCLKYVAATDTEAAHMEVKVANGAKECRGTATNFIPLVKGDILRVKGFDWESTNNGESPKIVFYDENKAYVTTVCTKASEIGTSNGLVAGAIDENGVLTYEAYIRADTNDQFVYLNICDRAKYVRISALRNVPEDEVVITVNNPIE